MCCRHYQEATWREERARTGSDRRTVGVGPLVGCSRRCREVSRIVGGAIQGILGIYARSRDSVAMKAWCGQPIALGDQGQSSFRPVMCLFGTQVVSRTVQVSWHDAIITRHNNLKKHVLVRYVGDAHGIDSGMQRSKRSKSKDGALFPRNMPLANARPRSSRHLRDFFSPKCARGSEK